MSNEELQAKSKAQVLFRDFTDALAQQLFFWGCDVDYSEGNLLCEYGLERRETDGVENSSCYRMDFEGDIIELHGFCVGHYSKTCPSFLFTRNPKRCWIYNSSEPPRPGFHEKDLVDTGSIEKLEAAGRRFLRWWLEYEEWISSRTPIGYREKCYRMFKKIPISKRWLTPDKARQWLHCYLNSPETLQRAREWKKAHS